MRLIESIDIEIFAFPNISSLEFIVLVATISKFMFSLSLAKFDLNSFKFLIPKSNLNGIPSYTVLFVCDQFDKRASVSNIVLLPDEFLPANKFNPLGSRERFLKDFTFLILNLVIGNPKSTCTLDKFSMFDENSRTSGLKD